MASFIRRHNNKSHSKHEKEEEEKHTTYPDWTNQVPQSFEEGEGRSSHSLSLSSSSRGTKPAPHLSPSSPSPQLLSYSL